MESNLSFFSLPFIDNADVDFSKIKGDCDFNELHNSLPSHGSLLGTDDVLAQFLSGDELLEEPDLNGPTTLHCEICKKQFDNAKKYYGHLRIHSKDNLWICDKCPNERFSTKQHLMRHSLTHKPLERVWRCPQCEMSFEALWRLQQHLFAKHIDYRPHKCDRCEMAFHKLSDLKKHKDIHDDVKKHVCKECKKGFNDVSNLKRHMLCHGTERPFACPGCGNRFKQAATMNRHIKNCSTVKPDTTNTDKTIRKNYCRVCGLAFPYKSELHEHCIREHSINPPPPKEPQKVNRPTELHVDTSATINIKPPSLVSLDAVTENNIICTKNNLVDTVIHTVDITNTAHTQSLNIVPSINNLRNINSNIVPDQIINVSTIPLNLITNVSVNSQGSINVNPNLSLNNPESVQGTNVTMNGHTHSSMLHTNSEIQNNIHNNENSVLDHSRTVDNIVDDILSAEDEYLNRNGMSNQMLNYNAQETENHENLMNQIELLKEMNHMHMLDDELLCNDLDFDSFQTMCNTNDMDYSDRNELLFDINDGRSMDQDIMNALYQVKGDNLPDLLTEPEILDTAEKANDYLVNPEVAVNECATIFETDVDLEASTNLAANLNQLIGENSVQYISTEHDDTFIISLNSEIDAEQLTDMLNIGVNTEDTTKRSKTENDKQKDGNVTQTSVLVKVDDLKEKSKGSKSADQAEPISVKINPVETAANIVDEPETKKKVKVKQRTLYVCRKCNKIFNKKDNYKSHRAIHDPSLRQHACRTCGERFGYRSTLNKHIRRKHRPEAHKHSCTQCDKTFRDAWMVKRHVARDHDLKLPFECKERDCDRRFYRQCDLDVHTRFHKNKRPYVCDVCERGFFMMSHLKRHVNTIDCTKRVKIEEQVKKKTAKIPLSNLLVINNCN